MAEINTKPIHIQVRDVHHKLIQNATIKVIQRKNGKILYNEKSSSGEIILDDIESLKDCHAFRVEIEHPHYKSRPKTNAPCIRLANLHKPHTLEFHYQDKLLVSNVSAEIRDNRDSTYTAQNNVYDTYNTQHRNKIATIQENNNANVLYLPQRSYNIDTKATTQKEAIESLQHIQIHLKAYYNQDTIPNKDKQSKTQRQNYQIQKTQTKWGYITSSPYQHTTKEHISSPIKEHETFRILTDLEGNEIIGEEATIHLKEEWLDKQVRFFAYIYKPHKDIGVDVEFEESIPPNVIRIETEDGSGEYIEIILPEEMKANSDEYSIRLAYNEHIPQDSTIRSDVDNNTLAMAARILLRNSPKTKKSNTPNKSTSVKPKSLSRQEVLEIVDKLPMGLKSNGEANPRIRLVKSQKELDELWERLTKNTKELQNGTDTRHGKPMYQRMLDDGTRINYRVDSKTGNSTIDINSRNPKTNIRIHIDK